MKKGENKITSGALTLAVMVIPVVANALVVIFINFVLYKVFSGNNMIDYLGISQKIMLALNVAPFFYATSVLGKYSFPIYRAIKTEIWDNKTLKRLSNAAFFIAVVSFSAWLIPILGVLITVMILDNPINWFFLLAFGTITVANGALAFMLCYYGSDFVISRFYLKKIKLKLPQSMFSDLFYISIRAKFFIFLVSVSITPLLVLTFALFIAHKILIEKNLGGDLSIPIILILAFSGVSILLTFLISDDFHAPLTRLGDAANQISRGNFDVIIPFSKADEIGQLTERFNEMSVSLKEKELIKDTLGKVVDPKVRDFMLGGNLNLGGEIKTATVLFSDIRSFTAISESLDPAQVVQLLNQYFERMSQCITANGGIVNKYIGDAVMAIFGAPFEMDDHAQKAFDAALSMLKARSELNEEFVAKGLPELKTGIGIHSGLLLSGNIGSKERLEYTVIGDTVNLSSRIESLCKKVNHDFLISKDTYDLLNNQCQKTCRYKGQVKVKGKQNYAKIYSVHYTGKNEFEP